MKGNVETTLTQNIFRILLALFMTYAGFSHLTFNRIEFQAQFRGVKNVEFFLYRLTTIFA